MKLFIAFFAGYGLCYLELTHDLQKGVMAILITVIVRVGWIFATDLVFRPAEKTSLTKALDYLKHNFHNHGGPIDKCQMCQSELPSQSPAN